MASVSSDRCGPRQCAAQPCVGMPQAALANGLALNGERGRRSPAWTLPSVLARRSWPASVKVPLRGGSPGAVGQGRCYPAGMTSPSRARSWLLTALTLGLGAALGVLVPRWLAVRQAAPDVLAQVRELSRLEGVSYHMERVVELKDEQRLLFGLVPADDAILLVASGDVVAGVDLGRLAPADVQLAADRRSVTIHLPPVEVFSARLDSTRTYVHTRKTDLLAERKESLESRARQAAEETLRAAADEAGIKERAAQSVSRTIKALVRSLGFAEVEVDFGGPA